METENSGVGGGLRAVRGLRVDARAVSRGFEATFWSLFASSVSLHLGSSSVSRFPLPAFVPAGVPPGSYSIVARRRCCNSCLWDTLSLNELRPLKSPCLSQVGSSPVPCISSQIWKARKERKREIKERKPSHKSTSHTPMRSKLLSLECTVTLILNKQCPSGPPGSSVPC